ncbi:hypothetical protein [Chitinophaga sp. Cy-1792]|uniref:hypothetical protein n=1 Tax=Chitinophaga sp. Cy-1792 TaxID=2608339 RepID=UPI0014243DE0|nr:hypothetical protein [Chitinophaga sp. Cy-1792]NIG56512.1 hypothetical protein [Chitinophaga sp. Cy-1792]
MKFKYAVAALITFHLSSTSTNAQGIFNDKKNLYTESYYSTGYYILKDSSVRKGLIKYNFDMPDRFRFREDVNSKAITISTDECIGFYEDGDKATFTVLENVKLPMKSLANKTISKCFAETRIQGDLNLFVVYFQQAQGFFDAPQVPGDTYKTRRIPATTFVLTKKGIPGHLVVPAKNKNFREALSEYLADKPGVVQFINGSQLTKDNIDVIVQSYNTSK